MLYHFNDCNKKKKIAKTIKKIKEIGKYVTQNELRAYLSI